jgi:hypothetical protein
MRVFFRSSLITFDYTAGFGILFRLADSSVVNHKDERKDRVAGGFDMESVYSGTLCAILVMEG